MPSETRPMKGSINQTSSKIFNFKEFDLFSALEINSFSANIFIYAPVSFYSYLFHHCKKSSHSPRKAKCGKCNDVITCKTCECSQIIEFIAESERSQYLDCYDKVKESNEEHGCNSDSTRGNKQRGILDCITNLKNP